MKEKLILNIKEKTVISLKEKAIQTVSEQSFEKNPSQTSGDTKMYNGNLNYANNGNNNSNSRSNSFKANNNYNQNYYSDNNKVIGDDFLNDIRISNNSMHSNRVSPNKMTTPSYKKPPHTLPPIPNDMYMPPANQNPNYSVYMNNNAIGMYSANTNNNLYSNVNAAMFQQSASYNPPIDPRIYNMPYQGMNFNAKNFKSRSLYSICIYKGYNQNQTFDALSSRRRLLQEMTVCLQMIANY